MTCLIVLYLCLASLTTLHLQVPCKLQECPAVRDHDVPVLINSACLNCSQLDLSTRQVTHVYTVYQKTEYSVLLALTLLTLTDFQISFTAGNMTKFAIKYCISHSP